MKMRLRRRLIIGLLSLAAVAYSLWLLAPLLGSNLSERTSYVSELYALGQPYSWLFRIGDITAGSAIVLAMLAWEPPRRPRWWTVTRWSALVFGLSTIVDASSPLPCAPLTEPECAAATHGRWQDVLHTISSTIAGTALITAAVALGLALRHTRSRPVVQVAYWILVAGLSLTTVWTLWEVAAASGMVTAFDALGIAQRVQVILAIGWLAMSAHLLRHRETRGDAPLKPNAADPTDPFRHSASGTAPRPSPGSSRQ